ncbi:DUF6875 domain-containing protein [Nocardia jinanensis]|uniref:DUF6875 domain-containing protein n=1 Tax=Nocardia jinanensis TaxID=382504 RepID=A0A917VT16_9NOCA|nr:hypothetical protein [Nocardia jinanensis]GGL11321.1 hypothetical protein GCM10011588_27260 [Nocardia jinanensis]
MTTDRVVGTRSGIEPANLFAPDPVSAAGEHPLATELRRWTTEYLCRPHSDLGRHGPVCPYMGHAITRRFLWAAFLGGRDFEVERIAAIVDDLYDMYPVLPPRDPPDSNFKAVLAVFPDLTDYTGIEAVQHDQKTRFVKQGLMLGQFYPGCRVAGLHNPDFPALDSPLPLLAVRHMVPTDFFFLNTRPEWIGTYLKTFAPAIPDFITTTMAGELAHIADSA